MIDLFNFTGDLVHDIDHFTSLWIIIGALWLLSIFSGLFVSSILTSLFEVVYEDGTTNSDVLKEETLGVFTGLGIPFSIVFGLHLYANYDFQSFLTVL